MRACLEAARVQVERVKGEAEHPLPDRTARELVAAARAARERENRVQRALAALPQARAPKSGAAAKENARVSTTDPEARVMKMGDGGYRPAYSLHLATATEGRAIVGVQVTNTGSVRGRCSRCWTRWRAGPAPNPRSVWWMAAS